MTKQQLQGLVRHVLTILAGVGVYKGLIDEHLGEILISGCTGIAGIVWSVISKK